MEDSEWILTPKEYLWLERVLARSPRYWVFNSEGCWKAESEPGGVEIKFFYPAVNISGRDYLPFNDGPLLVYDSATSVLLEAGWPVGGSESSGILVLPRYVYGSLGGFVAGIASPSGVPSLELIRAVGLSKPSPAVLASRYERFSVAMQALVLVLLYLLFATVIGGKSTLLARLVASLIILGVVLVVLSRGVVVPREQLSGLYSVSVGSRGFFELYGDHDKIININIKYHGNCTVPYNVSLIGPDGSRSSHIVENNTIVLARLHDPGIYRVVFTPIAGHGANCSARELLRSSLDASVTMAVKKYGGVNVYLKYSIMLFIVALLAGLYYWRRGITLSLDLASLISSTIYIELFSVLMVAMYSLSYAVMRSPCKLWGGCILFHKTRILGFLARPSTGGIVVYLVYSVVVASALFGLLAEMGVDKRLLLSGVSAVRLVVYKLVIGFLNVILPLVLTVVSVEWLLDPVSLAKAVDANILFIVKLLVVLTSLALPVYSLTMLASIATRRFSYSLLFGLLTALGIAYLAPPSWQPYRIMMNYLFTASYHAHLAVLAYLIIGAVAALASLLVYLRGDFVE